MDSCKKVKGERSRNGSSRLRRGRAGDEGCQKLSNQASKNVILRVTKQVRQVTTEGMTLKMLGLSQPGH
jgi:hypothetical protein